MDFAYKQTTRPRLALWKMPEKTRAEDDRKLLRRLVKEHQRADTEEIAKAALPNLASN